MKNKLKYLREQNDFTQQDIAELLKITRQNYSRWETGETLIPLFHLNTLANIYNTNIDYIIGISNNNTPSTKLKQIDQKLVGNNIKQIRIDNNLSMRKLAIILNTSHSTLSVYENGKYLIIISFALELSKKFGISLDWLCGRSKTQKIIN